MLRFWLIDLARGTHALRLLTQLEKDQYKNSEVLRLEMQDNCDSYFKLLKKQTRLFADIDSFSDLPVIDKGFAKANRSQLENSSFRGKRIRKKTGGSTGEPFVYFTGQRSQSFLWASILLSWRVTGYQLGEPVAFLAGSSLFGNGFKQRIYYSLMNASLLTAFDMTPETMHSYLEIIAKRKIRLIYGYAHAIHRLAQFANSRGEKPEYLLRGVVCTAEVLTEQMRSDIESAFGVACFSQYGCNDAGVSAYECEEKRGFHLITSRCFPEVLDGGRFVSTDMSNDVMFLPRYDTGDLVEMSETQCACGRGFPLISRVVGRSNDLVVDLDGRAVHSEFFTHMFREDSRITAFQILFNSREISINFHTHSPGGDFSEYLQRIRNQMRFESYHLVENEPFRLPGNGKHRFVMRADGSLEQVAPTT